MLLKLFGTLFFTFVISIGVGMFAEAHDWRKVDYACRGVVIGCFILFVMFGYYVIWQL